MAIKTDKTFVKNVEKIYGNIGDKSEFEVAFYNKDTKETLNFTTYYRLLSFLSSARSKYKIEKTNTLDIVYASDVQYENYRITVNGLDKINAMGKSMHKKRNHVIFSLISSSYRESVSDDIKIIKKKKLPEHVHDADNYDLRIRLAEELKITGEEQKMLSKLDETARSKIMFRYKDRISLIIVDDKNVTMRIDLTSVKPSMILDNVSDKPSYYELEVEIVKKRGGKLEKKYLDKLYDVLDKLLQVIQQSKYVISKTDANMVLSRYRQLLDKNNRLKLNGRQAVSLEIQHVVDKLSNNYGVTDKADGERYFLAIVDGKVYLISNNLAVKYSGLTVKKEYNDTVLDSELIFLKKERKHVLLAFDCLMHKGKDVRDENIFAKRLKYVDDVCDNCFNAKFKIKQYGGEFDLEKILKYHSKQIDSYMKVFNDDIADAKNLLVRRKYFILPFGGQDNEIFAYSKLLWDKYVLDENTNCPYILDGLVYHPIDQKYETIKKNIKFFDYKWKPEDKNSIDFYIEFEKNKDTGEILTLYDDTEEIKGKMYRICNLHVGWSSKFGEKPTLFRRKEDGYMAYLFIEDGQVRDLDGKIIQDKTVVEFYYNYDPSVKEQYRWVPMRTRLDKTENVVKYKKEYGNNMVVADLIWRSIINPFLMSDIVLLSKMETYSSHMRDLRKKVSAHLISLENRYNVYYQKTTNLAKPMRAFHNWVKDNLIYMYCSPHPHTGQRKTVIDFGCGRGGDIMKFWFAKVLNYVGVDRDNNGLTSATNGALSRYNTLKKKRAQKNFPKMTFIHADTSALLNVEEQEKIIGNNMSDKNRELLKRYFGDNNEEKYDIVNCQFMIHYMLKSQVTWDNFMKNINAFLKPQGHMLITCFDGEKVIDFLNGETRRSVHYTTNRGDKEIMFEIVKKFEGKGKGVGRAIDVHNAMFSDENVFITEYLVNKDFLESQLSLNCNMELIETRTFEDMYKKSKKFIGTMSNVEENDRTKKLFNNINKFYELDTEENKASFEMSKLNRYYIFRKRDDNMAGGEVKVGDKIFNSKRFIKRVNLDDKSLKGVIKNIYTTSFKKNMCKKVGRCMRKIKDDNLNAIAMSLKFKKAGLDGANIFILDNDGDKVIEQSYVNEDRPSIIIGKDGTSYYPIYKLKNGVYSGIFSSQLKFIKNMIAN